MTAKQSLLALLMLGAMGAGSCQTATEGRAPLAAAQTSGALADLERQMNTAPAAALADEAAYRAFAEFLRPVAPMTIGSYSAEDAGVVARDIVITFGRELDAGIRIGELRLYGADLAAMAAAGALDATAPATSPAQRIDARGVATFGLEGMMQKAMGAYVGKIADIAAAANTTPGTDVFAEEMRRSSAIDLYDVKASRLTVDGLILHAPEPGPAKDYQKQDVGEFLRAIAHSGRMMSFDAFAFSDLEVDYATGGEAAPNSMHMSSPFSAYRGWRRGDLDGFAARDLAWTMNSTAPVSGSHENGAAAAPVTINMTGGVGRYQLTGMRLGKLFDYWARSETPPSGDASLMSLGVWKSENEHYEIDGAPFYSLESAETDLSHFRWFLPTRITSSARNFTYDIGGFMKFAMAQAPENDQSTQEITAMLTALEKHGLSKLTSSYTAAYDWAPQNGATAISIDSDVAGLGRFEHRLNAGFPKFDALAALISAEDGAAKNAALGQLFAGSTLDGFSTRIVDRGILARVFAFAADLQGAASDTTGMIDPEQLRAQVALSLQAAGAASPMGALLGPIGDFIANGGALSVTAAPASPVPFAEIGKPGPDGADPVTRLGLSATQTDD